MKAASKKAPARAVIPGPKSHVSLRSRKRVHRSGTAAHRAALAAGDGRGPRLHAHRRRRQRVPRLLRRRRRRQPRPLPSALRRRPRNQLERLAVGSFTTEPRLALLKLLAELAPGALQRTQLYSGGAEAVEAAIRLAKSYTKKHEVVGFWGGFHGKTGGVMGLIGDEWKQKWGPLAPGTHLVPYADCYRCPFKLTHPECGMFCLDFIRQSAQDHDRRDDRRDHRRADAGHRRQRHSAARVPARRRRRSRARTTRC